MIHDLTTLMRDRICHGLKRRSITSCARWAETYRVMKPPFPGKWDWTHHPWLKEIHDPGTRRSVFRKAAQVGLTETFLNRTFYNADVRSLDTLYILPNERPDATDFSTSRFDAALRLSPHLQALFGDTKNVGLKRAGAVNVYIRGSRSRSALKSVPVANIIFDEVDEMTQENIVLALERTSGQVEPEEWFASTPTLPNRGIDQLYSEGTAEEFFFPCPRCSRQIVLHFPDCIKITADDYRDPGINDSYLMCPKCKGTLVHEEKPLWLSDGTWVSSYEQRVIRSFWISQLYSCTVSPSKIAEQYLRAQESPEDEQEFYNSKLGMPHVVAGARLTDELIDDCRGQHKNSSMPSIDGIFTMGVDVGHPWIHFVVMQWQFDKTASNDPHIKARARMVKYGKVETFEQLDAEMNAIRPSHCVVDINPERRAAEQFAQRFHGHVSLCIYGTGKSGRSIYEKEEEYQVTVDRTSWIDLFFSRFKGHSKRISLPIDLDHEIKDHLKAMVRIYERDKDGNPVGRYVNGNNPDHYAHACVYAEIGLSLVGKAAGTKNISGAFN